MLIAQDVHSALCRYDVFKSQTLFAKPQFPLVTVDTIPSAHAGGPFLEKKVGDVLSGLGAKNETDEKTLPARLSVNWSKDNNDDAALLWNMVK